MRRLIHRHPPGNNQRALAIFIERGYYRAFLRRAQSVMYERESIMAQALDEHFKGFEWRHCPGASTFWVRLPRFANSGSLVATAAAHGILVEPGDKYFYDELPAGLFFRLSVSSIPASRIPGSIERLAKAFADAERQR
jgi:GntR family transcriptional regulator/MocR family aminotransferase